MRVRHLQLTILPILLAASTCGCNVDRGSSTGGADSQESAAESGLGSPKVVALGRLEPANGIITISSLPGERLELLHVAEGDYVEAEDPLAQLASYRAYAAEVAAIEHRTELAPEQWQSKLTVAMARVRQAKAALEQAKAKQQEVELQKSMLPLLARKADRAELTYYKLSDLAEQDSELANDRELERYELQRDKADIDLEQAERRYDLAKVVADKAVEAAEADVQTALATLDELRLADPVPELRDQLDVATIRRDMSLLRAPVPGKVLKVFLQEGEVITDRPILQMANLGQMVCIAEVYESDAKKIEAMDDSGAQSPSARKVGDVVRIVSKAFRDEFDDAIWGTVEHVGSLVAPPGLQSRNPLAPADRSVVEVRVRIGLDDQVLPGHEDLNEKYTNQAADLVSLQVRLEFYEAGEVRDYFASQAANKTDVVDTSKPSE
jgi:HlyD family secretion protein